MNTLVHYRTTRRGGVQATTSEHYLREDIGCGCAFCEQCARLEPVPAAPLTAAAGRLAVLDTNVVLQQIDLLERPAGFADVVVPGTVLAEVKHRSPSVYTRLRALIADPARRFYAFANEYQRECYVARLPAESPNDRNDRAIRVVCQWYRSHLAHATQAPQQPSHQQQQVEIILVTNDRENAERARSMSGVEHVKAMSVKSYVAHFLADAHPELLDIITESPVVAGAGAGGVGGADALGAAGRGRALFEEFRPMSLLLQGVKSGLYHQGIFHVRRNNCLEASVVSRALGTEILIHGREHMNRVVEGDVVVVQILPRDQWKSELALIVDTDEQAQLAAELLEKDKAPAADAAGADDDGKKKSKTTTTTTTGTTSSTSGAPPQPVVVHKGEVPSGKIVGVLKRAWKPLCGSVDVPAGVAGAAVGSLQTLLFRPIDKRMPRVRIRTRQGAALAGKRIVVVMDTWERTAAWPSGHFVRELGAVGDKESETESILMEHDIPYRPFSEAVLKCLPPLPWAYDAVRDADPTRVDLRDRLVSSTDPPGCKDIDDALHAQRLPNGNIEVGVHIADVTWFVREGTPIDVEAMNRSTSVYLADRRIDMFPKPLTEDICSLREKVDRFAFSVLWEMTPNADVVGVRFCRSLIRSRHSFSYEEAQSRIDNAQLHDGVTEGLRLLMALARVLKARRLAAGALVLGSTEIKFTKDENYQPVDMELYQHFDTNMMVEEWMLAANVAVAQKTYEHFPSYAVLRNHPAPNPQMFEWLQVVLRARGYPPLDLTNSKTLAATLDTATDPHDPMINQLVRTLATRCLMQAKYFSSGTVASPAEFRHYGLAMDIYTHFTSPIRRYADVLAHRLLACALGLTPLSPNYNAHSIAAICDNMNHRHTMAQYASRASAGLYTVLLFRGTVHIEDGYVTRLRQNGFLVFLPKFGVEGIVHVCTPADPTAFVLDEHAQTLTSRDNPRTVIRVLDKVVIHVSVDDTDLHEQHLRLLCLRPAIHPVPAELAAITPINDTAFDLSTLLAPPPPSEQTPMVDGPSPDAPKGVKREPVENDEVVEVHGNALPRKVQRTPARSKKTASAAATNATPKSAKKRAPAAPASSKKRVH